MLRAPVFPWCAGRGGALEAGACRLGRKVSGTVPSREEKARCRFVGGAWAAGAAERARGAAGSAEIFEQNAHVRFLAQAAQGAFLDLAHAFACETQVSGYFFGRHFRAADAEKHFHHQAFAF